MRTIVFIAAFIVLGTAIFGIALLAFLGPSMGLQALGFSKGVADLATTAAVLAIVLGYHGFKAARDPRP